jgi:hypothetical protein
MTSQHPILHAPIADIATPARDLIDSTRAFTRKPFNVDLFSPRPAHSDDAGYAPNPTAHIKGNTDFTSQWTAQRAPRATALAAPGPTATLATDFAEASGQSHSHSMPRITK